MTETTLAYRDMIAFVHSQLENRHAAFSIGVMGAVGEYFIADQEPQINLTKTGGTAQTWGGRIAINLPRDVIVTAYESVAGAGPRWTQGVLFTIPHATELAVKPTGLKTLGLDESALSRDDKKAALFDLGPWVFTFFLLPADAKPKFGSSAS